MQVAPLGGADFAAHAREYCGFVECLHELTLAQRLRGLATRLARLYALAAESAEAGVSQQSEGYCVDDDFETVAIARDLIICEFDQFDLYLVPLDPFDVAAATDKNIGTAQLSDDVLDIWADLQRGLRIFDAGFPDQAYVTWRDDFDVHWGSHAINALSVLHAALAHLR